MHSTSHRTDPPRSISDLQYVTELPPTQRAWRRPKSNVEMRNVWQALLLEIKMWHLAEKPNDLRWYIIREVDPNLKDDYELNNLKQWASAWGTKMRKIDWRYKIVRRGHRVYATYDYDGRVIDKHSNKEIRKRQ